jgi:hypothetical protein
MWQVGQGCHIEAGKSFFVLDVTSFSLQITKSIGVKVKVAGSLMPTQYMRERMVFWVTYKKIVVTIDQLEKTTSLLMLLPTCLFIATHRSTYINMK